MERAIVGGGSGGYVNSKYSSGALQAGNSGNFGGSDAKTYSTGSSDRTMVLWCEKRAWRWVDGS